MKSYHVARILLSNKDFVIFVSDMDLSRCSDEHRQVLLQCVIECVSAKGYPGTVALVWSIDDSSLGFFPRNRIELRDYVMHNSIDAIKSKFNGEIDCPF
ncbi:MAG: hypothetical protein V1799_02255 [bacterium]